SGPAVATGDWTAGGCGACGGIPGLAAGKVYHRGGAGYRGHAARSGLGAMLRRQAIAVLLSGCAGLERFFDGVQGAALLLDARTRRRIAVHNAPAAERQLAAPGSVIKPFVLQALLRSGKLSDSDQFLCRGERGCSHPPPAGPFTVRTALAYSCNSFVV